MFKDEIPPIAVIVLAILSGHMSLVHFQVWSIDIWAGYMGAFIFVICIITLIAQFIRRK